MDYGKVVEDLKAKFPNGTVQKNDSTKRYYIPNSKYLHRINTVTQGEWNKEIKSIDINTDLGIVIAIVRVTIAEYSRDGHGRYQLKRGSSIDNAIDQAVNIAFVNAIDTWEMGWVDLGRGSSDETEDDPSNQTTKGQRICVKCKEPLTAEDVQYLEKNPHISLDYHIETCLPPFFKKEK